MNLLADIDYVGADWKLVHLVEDEMYLVIAKNRVAVMQGNMHLTRYDRVGNDGTWVIPEADIKNYFDTFDASAATKGH